MMRHAVVSLALSGAGALLGCCGLGARKTHGFATPGGDAASTRPHIISILQDDLGWWDSGVHNPDAVAYSRNISQLARNGIVLSHHYTHWHCSPSRRSFLSGRLPIHHGEQLSSNSGDDIDLRMTWVSDKLASAGYQCHWYGKWHTGFKSLRHLGIHNGFQQTIGSLQTGGAYAGTGHTLRWEDDHPLYLGQNTFIAPPPGCTKETGVPAAPTTGSTTSCEDLATFHDVYGSCDTYASELWCAAGEVGPSWQADWGSLGAGPLAACCACGGGHKSSHAGSGDKLSCDEAAWMEDTVMKCGSLIKYSPATTPAECCAACSDLGEACTHWVYAPMQGNQDTHCHLKTGKSDCKSDNNKGGHPTSGTRTVGRRQLMGVRKTSARRQLSGKKKKHHGKKNTTVLGPQSCTNAYSTDLWGGLAVKTVREYDTSNSSASLYIHLCFEAMHTPYSAGKWNPTGDVYKGMMWRSDVYVGQLVQQLHQKSMYDNTLIVYLADNGGTIKGNNHPLRGEKHSNWEGAMKVTAFVSGGLVPARLRGTKSAVNTHIVDWYATFASLAGVSPLDDPPVAPLPVDPADPRKNIYGEQSFPAVDGVDIWPMLTGTSPELAESDAAHADLVLSKEVMISGRWKLLVAQPHFKNQKAGWKDAAGKWREPVGDEVVGCQGQVVGPAVSALPVPVQGGTPCLFDLHSDPNEHRDVSDAHPDIVSAMWKRLNTAILGQRDCNGWSYKGTSQSIPGPRQPDGSTSCSPPTLLGPCNTQCAKLHWAKYGAPSTKLSQKTDSGAMKCGIPGCGAAH